MEKIIILLAVVSTSFFACKNAYENEIGEVDALINIITDTENALLSVDTSKTFAAARQIKEDIDELNATKDTLTKEQAFLLDDYFSNKKKLYRLSANYSGYIEKVKHSKNQLLNLKQDLLNDKISKEDYHKYYEEEQFIVMDLNAQINKAVGGLDEALEKLRIFREDIVLIIEEHKQHAAETKK
jgi:predicted nuclease with TOPRIM domain